MDRREFWRAYKLYTKTDHWQWLRSRKLAESGTACQCCPAKPSAPHVHHIRYKNFIDVELSDLAVLCEECHNDFHFACQKRGIDYIGIELLQIVEIIMEIRADPKFIKRKERMAARAAKRAQDPPTVPNLRRVVRAGAKQCRKAGYTLRSVMDFAASLNKIIARQI